MDETCLANKRGFDSFGQCTYAHVTTLKYFLNFNAKMPHVYPQNSIYLTKNIKYCACMGWGWGGVGWGTAFSYMPKLILPNKVLATAYTLT